MKSKFEALRNQLSEAFDRFNEVMKLPKNDVVRDSAIQRFEFTFELLWKTLREYLRNKGADEAYFPRDVFKDAFRIGLIEEDDAWLDMLDDRNATSHIYKEEMADRIFSKFSSYLKLMKRLVNKLKGF